MKAQLWPAKIILITSRANFLLMGTLMFAGWPIVRPGSVEGHSWVQFALATAGGSSLVKDCDQHRAAAVFRLAVILTLAGLG